MGCFGPQTTSHLGMTMDSSNSAGSPILLCKTDYLVLFSISWGVSSQPRTLIKSQIIACLTQEWVALSPASYTLCSILFQIIFLKTQDRVHVWVDFFCWPKAVPMHELFENELPLLTQTCLCSVLQEGFKMGLTLEGTVFCLDPLDSRCWCQEQEIQICVQFVWYAYTSFLITFWQVVYVCQYIFEDLNFLQVILLKRPSLLIYNVYFKNNW